jgi:hypothetical protein
MIRKILNIFIKIVVFLVVLYFVLTLLILPLGGKWAIQSQGTKILKTPVKVQSVFFNPFLWRLNIRGFEISDVNKAPMLEFSNLSVDVSFIELLKKKYRIESIVLNVPSVHVVLLPDGKINLLNLIPSPASTPKETKAPSNSVKANENQAMPTVTIDTITMNDGRVYFTDENIAPGFKTQLTDINLNVTGFSTDPAAQTKVVFKAKLDEKGTIESEALIKALANPMELETNFALNSYALEVVTPYSGKYTGRGVKDGKLDFKMDYRISDNKLTASHKILIQRFDFGEKVESKDALSLPFGLAIALLEDPQGRIKITLPVSGNLNDPQFKFWHVVGDVAKNFFMKLVTKPFSVFASIIGGDDSGTEDLAYVRFAPGESELTPPEKEKLRTLVKGLLERPKLKLEINGSYDPVIDWRAIKARVFNNDYTKLKKESTKTETWVYQMLYQERFGVRDLWALTKKYKTKQGYDAEKLNEEIKRQLIEGGSADKFALETLAKTRAKVLYDFILGLGFETSRLNIGAVKESQATMGQVPVEFTLTVFDK